MARGKFIVFEGGDGSGKDTFIARLKEKYSSRNDFVFTRDPGGTELGEAIRNLVLSHSAKGISVRTEILAFHTARAELVANVIAPALESGKNVISNRFELSAFAYQIYGREHPELLPFMQTLSAFVLQDCMPDLCIFLDVPPRQAIARTQNRAEEPSRFDEESIAFHERVHGGYRKHLNDFGKAVVIDSSHSIDDVWTDVEDAVQSVVSN